MNFQNPDKHCTKRFTFHVGIDCQFSIKLFWQFKNATAINELEYRSKIILIVHWLFFFGPQYRG